MCLDARLLPHKIVNMNINNKPKWQKIQNFEPKFYREKEQMWGPHVSDTIFLTEYTETDNL